MLLLLCYVVVQTLAFSLACVCAYVLASVYTRILSCICMRIYAVTKLFPCYVASVLSVCARAHVCIPCLSLQQLHALALSRTSFSTAAVFKKHRFFLVFKDLLL